MTENVSKNSYFVTGGSGFIGSHVVDWLLSHGHKVTVYDNLVSGKKQDIEPHIGKQGFSFIKADICDFEKLKGEMSGHDIVWHLAANTDIQTGNRITDLDLKNCTVGTYNVLEAMKQLGMKELMFASSATVYGDVRGQALSEGYGPLLPISLYGAGKLAGECLISSYSHLFDIRAVMFRFANVVGGRMGHGVIYDFIQKLKKTPDELIILGNGKQKKPFFLVEECIDGMLFAFRNSRSPYDVFNLGAADSLTVTRIGEVVAEEMGLKNVKFTFTGGDRGWPGDVPIVVFDVNKMSDMGWQVKHTSEEAVRIAAQRLIKEQL